MSAPGVVFVIEDDLHADLVGEYPTRVAAVAALRVLAATPWDAAPNRPPCAGWRSCGRHYEIVEYDRAATPWRELSRVPALTISAVGADWLLSAEG